MNNSIRDFVMSQPFFCSHNHHCSLKAFDDGRPGYNHRSLLGYADGDLWTAAGPRPQDPADPDSVLARCWGSIRTTGYGRAVTLACQELFGLDYSPDNFAKIGEALQAGIQGKTAAEVYDLLVKSKANTRWVVNDIITEGASAFQDGMYPDYYRLNWRKDGLFCIADRGPVQDMEKASGIFVTNLDRLVEAMNVSINRVKETGRFAALKVGFAYTRDLVVTDPTRHEAELALNRILNPKLWRNGLRQENAMLNAAEARPLSDYLLHRMLERASDENLIVQFHTGYLAGNWGGLHGTAAMYLLPILFKYRRVRFDVFHASWPEATELGAIAKQYPNVYPDLCWAWTASPAHVERALVEWLDAVPFNKILGYGADTLLPWCDVGYAKQARLGIARALEQKIAAGYFSAATAQEVAEAIMLKNGEELFGLSGAALRSAEAPSRRSTGTTPRRRPSQPRRRRG